MYECRVERDSVSRVDGSRLTSFVITFPRIVLAETVTHRMSSDTWGDFECSWAERTTTRDISKNSASSRAIPLAKMVQKVFDDPYVPERFSANGKGMQGHGWLTGEDHDLAVYEWLNSRDNAVSTAILMMSREDRAVLYEQTTGPIKDLVGDHLRYKGPSVSVHKQDVNRLLEPWAWVTQVVTSSRWDNFFALRCHKAAHPAFQKIARMMFLAQRKSTPQPLRCGQWHLPFVSLEDQQGFEWAPTDKGPLPDLIKFSAARCAWISYENHDREGTPEAMLRTFDRLFAEVPVHASPLEHQATPFDFCHSHPHWQGNLKSWVQARKLIPHEEITRFEPGDEEIASWELNS